MGLLSKISNLRTLKQQELITILNYELHSNIDLSEQEWTTDDNSYEMSWLINHKTIESPPMESASHWIRKEHFKISDFPMSFFEWLNVFTFGWSDTQRLQAEFCQVGIVLQWLFS